MLDEQGVDNVVTEETNEPVQEPEAIEEGTGTSDDQGSSAESHSEQPVKDENVERVQNWRVLREAKDKAERERDEALRQLQGSSKHKEEVVQEYNLSDDDLAEGKHLKAIREDSNRKIARIESQLVEQRIKSQYPDFDKIVNPDTLGMLRDEDPELAESILSNKNMHSQMVTAYKSIKRLGIVTEDKYSRDKEKALSNSSKPRPVVSVSPQQGESPLSRANAFADGFTKELGEQLWREMEDIRKRS